jgi:hypothetical protein
LFKNEADADAIVDLDQVLALPVLVSAAPTASHFLR